MTKTDTTTDSRDTDVPEAQIAALLEYRYGNGLVYLPRQRGRDLLALARKRGYIDTDGYLTRKGRTLIARYHYM